MNPDREPTIRALRIFGAIGVPALCGLGVWILGPRIGWTASSLVGGLIAANSLLCAGVAPERLRPLERTWRRLTAPVGRVVSAVAVALVFGLVVVPIALVLRGLGRDPLDRRSDPQASSYWFERQRAGNSDLRSYFKSY